MSSLIPAGRPPATDRALVRRVADRVIRERVRTGLPLGLSALAPAHFAQLFAQRGGEIRHCLLPFVFQYVPTGPAGRWELLLSLFNGERADEVACLYVWSRIAADDDCGGAAHPDEHDLFAVVCAAHLSTREGDRAFVRRFREDFSSLPGMWTRRPLRELLQLARRIWKKTDAALQRQTGSEGPAQSVEALTNRARGTYQAARVARLRDDFLRAEVLYAEALNVAGLCDDRETVLHAYLGLGKLAVQRGNAPLARRWFSRCEKQARLLGMQSFVAMALHDQFSLATNLGEFEKADRLGRAAYAAYGPNHTELFRLACDQASCWLMQGEFGRALTVFEEVVAHITDTGEQTLVWGCIARAAGGVGNLARFAAARVQVDFRVCLIPEHHHVPNALLHLARGAGLLGEIDLATDLGTAVLRMAEERGQGLLRFEVEAFLQSRCGGPVGVQMRTRQNAPFDRHVAALVTDLRRQHLPTRIANT